MRALFISAVMALLATGCHTTTTCDGREGQSEFCQIHHELMQTEMLDNDHHKKLPSQEYMEARAKYFIHSYPFILPEKCDKCAVYICDDCVRTEQEWRRRHPNEK